MQSTNVELSINEIELNNESEIVMAEVESFINAVIPTDDAQNIALSAQANCNSRLTATQFDELLSGLVSGHVGKVFDVADSAFDVCEGAASIHVALRNDPTTTGFILLNW